MIIYLIRHAKTKGNEQKRYIGKTDESLSALGVAEAQAKAKHMPKEISKVFVSPLRRTRETADLLFPYVEKTIIPNFREMDFGVFEGKTFSELSNNDDYQAWLRTSGHSFIPEGESLASFSDRTCQAFLDVVQKSTEESLAFVIHGGSIMAIMHQFVDSNCSFYTYQLKNLEYFMLEYQDNKFNLLERVSW